jgi:nicotinamidase/pyrazinamidase
VSSDSLVFFDIDTQVDFMSPAGKLYVKGAEKIIPNLRRLMTWAREHGVPVISSADAHAPNDPEFQHWPPHCVVGTPGQQRIPETSFSQPIVIPCRPGAFVLPKRWTGQFIVEKRTYSAEDNPNFGAMVDALRGRHAIVFGVATEVCVRADVLALRRRGMKVDVVTDAIKPINEVAGRKALEEMVGAGAGLVTTSKVCQSPELAKVP